MTPPTDGGRSRPTYSSPSVLRPRNSARASDPANRRPYVAWAPVPSDHGGSSAMPPGRRDKRPRQRQFVRDTFREVARRQFLHGETDVRRARRRRHRSSEEDRHGQAKAARPARHRGAVAIAEDALPQPAHEDGDDRMIGVPHDSFEPRHELSQDAVPRHGPFGKDADEFARVERRPGLADGCRSFFPLSRGEIGMAPTRRARVRSTGVRRTRVTSGTGCGAAVSR